MNLVVDNTKTENEEESNSAFFKTEIESSDAIFVIQMTKIETYDSEVLSRHTHNQFFKTREDANAMVEKLMQTNPATLFYVQPLWPSTHTGPKFSVVN